MMGLVKKNLWAGSLGAFLIIFVTVIAAIAGFVIRTPDAHIVATFAIGGACGTNIMSHFHRKNDALWQQLETTMPIKLAFVELSRYLSFLVVFALVVVITAVYTLTNYLGGAFYYPHAAASTLLDSLAMVMGFYFLLAALQFPLLRIFSARHSVGILYGCFIATFFLFFGAAILGARLPENIQDIGGLLLAAATFLLFVLSYFISVQIYRRRCAV